MRKRKTAVELTESGAFRKWESLRIWQQLPENMELTPAPIPYKHTGTTIDEDGVRITGSYEFITAVMSRLKPLLQYEAGGTRLGIAFSELTDKVTGARMAGRYRCTIQVHERGR
jgi:hypothetical protein